MLVHNFTKQLEDPNFSSINIFVGPTNCGKSYVLTDLYREALESGKNVFYLDKKIPVRELLFDLSHHKLAIIDGIEDGRYYTELSAIADALNKVKETSRVIITTHSKELLEYIHKAGVNIRLYRFYLDEVNRDIVAQVYTSEEFHQAMERGEEVR